MSMREAELALSGGTTCLLRCISRSDHLSVNHFIVASAKAAQIAFCEKRLSCAAQTHALFPVEEAPRVHSIVRDWYET